MASCLPFSFPFYMEADMTKHDAMRKKIVEAERAKEAKKEEKIVPKKGSYFDREAVVDREK